MAATRSVIGQSITRGEGPDKVSGKAVYAADISLPGMLWGKVLRSPYPYARIANIETAQAKIGRRMIDMPVLAQGVVRFVGEKVAAVAAVDLETAGEALLLIDVEYEELTPVFDAEEAMRPDAPDLHPDMESYQGLPQPPSGINNAFAHITWEKGDIEQGFRESDLIFEHTFNAQLMHQAYIEPHACLVSADRGRCASGPTTKTPTCFATNWRLVGASPPRASCSTPAPLAATSAARGRSWMCPCGTTCPNIRAARSRWSWTTSRN